MEGCGTFRFCGDCHVDGRFDVLPCACGITKIKMCALRRLGILARNICGIIVGEALSGEEAGGTGRENEKLSLKVLLTQIGKMALRCVNWS